MRRYSNIPIKERKRNADRCYRHEENLEERAFKRYIKEMEKQKKSASENITDKDRECVQSVQNEVYKRLEAIAKGG